MHLCSIRKSRGDEVSANFCPKYFGVVLLLYCVVLLQYHGEADPMTGSRRIFGKFGSVNIDLKGGSAGNRWSSKWPEVIQLVNTVDHSGEIPKGINKYANKTSGRYPYRNAAVVIASASYSSGKPTTAAGAGRTAAFVSPKRTFSWQNDDLIIAVNMTALTEQGPACTRLVPPLTWLAASGSKVKVLQQSSSGKSLGDDKYAAAGESANDVLSVLDAASKVNKYPSRGDSDSSSGESVSSQMRIVGSNTLAAQDAEQAGAGKEATVVTGAPSIGKATTTATPSAASDVSASTRADSSGRYIEITVKKSLAEKSLSCLRMNGFSRADIYRMLEKGPWIMAFDISSALPRLYHDLKKDLGMDEAAAVHVVSHCPYLIAQYHQYKGRDVASTVKALRSVGYAQKSMLKDIMRFPSVLSAPPDRILGWKSLLNGYGVACGEAAQFGKFMQRAPFIFNLNPPQPFDTDMSHVPTDSTSTTAAEYVVYHSRDTLDCLTELRIPDLDKVIRTQPMLLLTKANILKERVQFLLQLFSEDSSVGSMPGRNIHSPSLNYHQSRMHGQYSTDNSMVANNSDKERSATVQNDSRSIVALETPPSERYISALGLTVPVSAVSTFSSLVLTYPGVLSIEQSNMEAAVGALTEMGFKQNEIIKLIKVYPPMLSKSPLSLRGSVSFVRQHCDIWRTVDLFNFLVRHPWILGTDVAQLLPKKDYLYKSLNGTPAMLQDFPAYFSYDLETHTIPRAEFVRALGQDPLFQGLAFLLNAREGDLAAVAGSSLEVFRKFKSGFNAKWQERKAKLRSSVPADVPEYAELRRRPRVNPDFRIKDGGFMRATSSSSRDGASTEEMNEQGVRSKGRAVD